MRKGAIRWRASFANVCGERRDQGRARSSVYLSTSVIGQRRAAHRRTGRNARAQSAMDTSIKLYTEKREAIVLWNHQA